MMESGASDQVRDEDIGQKKPSKAGADGRKEFLKPSRQNASSRRDRSSATRNTIGGMTKRKKHEGDKRRLSALAGAGPAYPRAFRFQEVESLNRSTVCFHEGNRSCCAACCAWRDRRDGAGAILRGAPTQPSSAAELVAIEQGQTRASRRSQRPECRPDRRDHEVRIEKNIEDADVEHDLEPQCLKLIILLMTNTPPDIQSDAGQQHQIAHALREQRLDVIGRRHDRRGPSRPAAASR